MKRLVTSIGRSLYEDQPHRSAVVAFLRATVGPLVGGLLGAVAGALLGFWLMMTAGHGIAHSGAAAGLFLGVWALAIAVGAGLGIALFLSVATLVRGARFLLGRRPWPWSGSVHLGALLLALMVVVGMRSLGRYGSQHASDDATVVRLAAGVLGFLLAIPAMIVGGLIGGWVHRRPHRPGANDV